MFETFGITKHGNMPDFIYEMPFNEWYMVYGGIVLVANTVQRYVILSSPKYQPFNQLSLICDSALHVMSVQKSAKRSSKIPLFGLLPSFATWTLVPFYLYLQPVILHRHLVPFTFYVGLVNAYSVGLIILAHLTKSPNFPYQNVLNIPLAMAVADSLGLRLGLWPSVLGDGTYQIGFMFACLGLGVGVYGSFVASQRVQW